jgi:hypothetical protein
MIKTPAMNLSKHQQTYKAVFLKTTLMAPYLFTIVFKAFGRFDALRTSVQGIW